uniref:Pectin acetylesterase n=1 Tax=Anthurium amnicola TaxID=1678845 RepID=A0A1D1YJ90_9ARAE
MDKFSCQNKGVAENLPQSCSSIMDPTLCFFPQNLINHIQTPIFLLNSAYDQWQLVESLVPRTADPTGIWNSCKRNHTDCSEEQITVLQGFRNQMLNAVQLFSMSWQNGLFINSCFAHCQSENQYTWFANDSPVLKSKRIAEAVGDWFFDRFAFKAIGCPYPCDTSCLQQGGGNNRHSLFFISLFVIISAMVFITDEYSCGC